MSLGIERWNRPLPRYTSYPTAVQFNPLAASQVGEAYRDSPLAAPLSLYLHIPFCRSMCLFCACSVTLNRRSDRQARYIELLCQELELVAKKFPEKRRLTQIHFGGGTPTILQREEFSLIFETLRRLFLVDSAAEISVEADPRTVYADRGQLLGHLYQLGCNRLSFGVQDLDATVQEAVRRRQSEEMVEFSLRVARELGFTSFHCDLIYGLPFQTNERFQRTMKRMIEWRPNRLSLFSYAKVPWLKPHQKALPEEAEPSPEAKWNLFLGARVALLEAGYVSLGMDHFVLADDSLALALPRKEIQRNFQGYSLKLAEELVGCGASAIGYVGNTYLQNSKELEFYENQITQGKLPVQRGLRLTPEDLERAWVIQELMCYSRLRKEEFAQRFHQPFDTWVVEKQIVLGELFEQDPAELRVVPEGQLLIRWAASTFDAYLTPSEQRFSKAL